MTGLLKFDVPKMPKGKTSRDAEGEMLILICIWFMM